MSISVRSSYRSNSVSPTHSYESLEPCEDDSDGFFHSIRTPQAYSVVNYLTVEYITVPYRTLPYRAYRRTKQAAMTNAQTITTYLPYLPTL